MVFIMPYGHQYAFWIIPSGLKASEGPDRPGGIERPHARLLHSCTAYACIPAAGPKTHRILPRYLNDSVRMS
jgi:hypothetical protein